MLTRLGLGKVDGIMKQVGYDIFRQGRVAQRSVSILYGIVNLASFKKCKTFWKVC